MGKRRFDKTGINRKKATREYDASYRLTHLWTASHLTASQAPSVSRFYLKSSRQICRRINMITDSVTIKRRYCKHCFSLLVPGLGPTPPKIRLASKREQHLCVTCGYCGKMKRYLTREPSRMAQKKKERGVAVAAGALGEGMDDSAGGGGAGDGGRDRKPTTGGTVADGITEGGRSGEKSGDGTGLVDGEQIGNGKGGNTRRAVCVTQ